MTITQILLLLVIFISVASFVYAIGGLVIPAAEKKRLDLIKGSSDEMTPATAYDWQEKAGKLVSPIAKLALPEEGWENSPVRVRLIRAGYRGETAAMLYYSAKTLLTFLFPAVFIFYTSITNIILTESTFMLYVLISAAFGYYLPNFILSVLIKKRQREVFESFPDALDLMTICIEAGLSLDAVIAKTASEMHLSSKILAEELHLVTLELRAGASRVSALRNLAARTGVDDVEMLVSMLIQADRFGTSIADSLRVHADSLRVKRRLMAEELGAKLPTKLLFPMILFIFPALMLVLLGPSFLMLKKMLSSGIVG